MSQPYSVSAVPVPARRHKSGRPSLTPVAAAVWAMCCVPAIAQESAEKILPRIEVIGEGETAVSKQAGSVAVITQEAIKLAQPLSTQDALKGVPGMTVREEEGYGFIPNIGLRGLNPNRSQKLLVLEDGVPVAPSLFIANESYYSPRIERMEGIEVLKGAAGLRYGPTTIGGVINYQTKKPEDGVVVTGKVGSHGYHLLGLDAGGRSASGDAVGGISLLTSEGDGFRNNGFKMNDVVVKGGMAIGEHQYLSAKFTHYSNDVNTSYVGLRPNEYRNTPTKNPAPSDYFLSERNSFDINHEIELNANAKIKTLLYWSQLQRDYWRRPVDSRSANGTEFEACGQGSTYCMVGAARRFDMVGVDSRLFLNHNTFGLINETELGVRVHTESRRNKTFSSNTDANARTGTLTADQDSEANSFALYGQNRFVVNDRLAITPGLRIESYSQKDKNLLTAVAGKTNNTEFVPGIGATWQLTSQAQLFTGVFRGFSPAMLSQSIIGGVDQRLDAERSVNIEVGVRGKLENARYELTAFQMDFSNQIVNQAVSSGVTQTNAGQTLNQGVEGLLMMTLGQGWSGDVNFTYLPTAKYNSNRTGSTDNVYGNRLPYAPELTTNLGLTYKRDALTTRVSGTYVSSQFVDSLNTLAESTDGTKGLISSHVVLNLSARYQLNPKTTLFAAVRNLGDKKYIASRNPDGIFPGAVRNVEVGMSYKF
jgi:Fe(3+) dicitrate transport protein